MVDKYDALLQAKLPRDETEAVRNQVIQELTVTGEPGIASYPKHVAQSFQPKSGQPKARCVRCRRTFEYMWVWEEDIVDIKLFPWGSCAEYRMYLACMELEVQGGRKKRRRDSSGPSTPNRDTNQLEI